MSVDESLIGEIVADRAYTRTALKRHLGWSDSAVRQAIRRGLPVKRVGKSSCVLGSDFLLWLRQQPDVSLPTQQNEGN